MHKKRLPAEDKVESWLLSPPSSSIPLLHTAYHIAQSFKQTVGLELCLWFVQYLIVWRLITGKE